MSASPSLRRNQGRAMPGAPQNGDNAGGSREPHAGIAACVGASDASRGSTLLLVSALLARAQTPPLAAPCNLPLPQDSSVESGLTIRMAPNFERTRQGLLLSSFIARIHAAGTRAQTAAAETDQETHVPLEYAPASPNRPAGLTQFPSSWPSKFLMSSQ